MAFKSIDVPKAFSGCQYRLGTSDWTRQYSCIILKHEVIGQQRNEVNKKEAKMASAILGLKSLSLGQFFP